MAEGDYKERDDAEVQRLMKKADDGALNIVQKIIQRKEVQDVLKRNINKQTLVSGVFMGLFLVGFFQIFNVMKTLIGYDWRGDLLLGIAMLIIGATYMVSQIMPRKVKE